MSLSARESFVRKQCKRVRLPDSSEQGAVAFRLQRLHGLFRQSDTRLLERFEAGIKVDKGELEVQRGGKSFEYPAAGGYDFASDAVAGYQAWRLIA